MYLQIFSLLFWLFRKITLEIFITVQVRIGVHLFKTVCYLAILIASLINFTYNLFKVLIVTFKAQLGDGLFMGPFLPGCSYLYYSIQQEGHGTVPLVKEWKLAGSHRRGFSAMVSVLWNIISWQNKLAPILETFCGALQVWICAQPWGFRLNCYQNVCTYTRMCTHLRTHFFSPSRSLFLAVLDLCLPH